MTWMTVVCKRVALAMLALAGLCTATAATAWWQPEWPYRKQIVIDPAAAGVALAGEAANLPVLVRLHEGVFHFADSLPDGSDLRFVAADDKTPLKFHIEKFDPVFSMAQVWVQLPKVAAGQPQQIWMYYGNEEATPLADTPALSYDASHALVYHFGERETPPRDATANEQDAAATVATVDAGLIGAGAVFNGSTTLALPAVPALSTVPTTELTLSFWLKPAASNATSVIYSQRDPAAGELRIGLNAGVPYVGVAQAGGVLVTSSPTAPLAAGGWHHLAMVADSTHVRLFIDGKESAFLERTLSSNAGPAFLGGDVVNGAVQSGYAGELDEFSIAGSARSGDWLALVAANQGVTDKLVVFGADEQQSSFSSGYAGILLGAVTLDGWLVIGVLVIMMFISWAVMWIKGVQIARVGKANAVFLGAYRQAGGDLGRLHHALAMGGKADLGLDDGTRVVAAGSPVLHMFNEGIRELQQRIGREGQGGRNVVLSEQSIEAIRASLNAILVREQQSLSQRMVLLTIAISGGPFIGLLGTVVGVMITFAAVAASGDVNVNAIAPGIAAALVATVAGLFVAIPALFGYNYLITRVKECTVEMQVFVDVFVTRIAENYNDGQALHAMADD